MPVTRAALLRSACVVAMILVAACGSGGATASDVPASGQSSSAAGSQAGPAVPPAPSIRDCPTGQNDGYQKLTVNGAEAYHFCGPATATVSFSGSTARIGSGSCTTTDQGWYVSVGTQLFSNPNPGQDPDLLVILVEPSTGVGPIFGVVNHKHWLITGESKVVFGSDQFSGTFAGSSSVGGGVYGSYTCLGIAR
jgi:hypothetical protein